MLLMSKQVLESERVRDGLRDILLGPVQLYEALRSPAEVAKWKAILMKTPLRSTQRAEPIHTVMPHENKRLSRSTLAAPAIIARETDQVSNRSLTFA
jgi:hypothetical protein